MFTLKFFDTPGSKERQCDECFRYGVYHLEEEGQVLVRYVDKSGREVQREVYHKVFFENSSGKTVDRVCRSDFVDQQ